MDENSKLILL